MSKYLDRYIGTYRVKAHYDYYTKDYPRDDLGNIDPSFDDFYIDCQRGVEIRHSDRDVLACYIPNVNYGKNILRTIYEDKVGKRVVDIKKVSEELLKYNILKDITITDGEVYFMFRADIIDYIAKLVKARTHGASIRPLSVKNLPRTPYTIPDEDIKLYKQSIKGIEDLKVGHKVRQYAAAHPEYKASMRKEGLTIKQYAHKIGKWREFCEFISG